MSKIAIRDAIHKGADGPKGTADAATPTGLEGGVGRSSGACGERASGSAGVEAAP